jgi:hypothetical protein
MAPAHTQTEAWELLISGISEHRSAGRKLILVDGQPRDLEQAKKFVAMVREDQNALVLPVLLHASAEIREKRCRGRSQSEAELDLCLRRLVNDPSPTLDVLAFLAFHGIETLYVTSDGPGYDPVILASMLLAETYKL